MLELVDAWCRNLNSSTLRNVTTRKYTREILAPLVADCNSRMEVIRRLGIKCTGSANTNIKRYIDEYGLDTSHFNDYRSFLDNSRGWNRRSWEDILVVRPPLSRPERAPVLRRALEAVGVPYQCNWCSLTGEWNNKPIKLQVDHINGDRCDNRADNLRFLCPNCHSQTETWGLAKSVIKAL